MVRVSSRTRKMLRGALQHVLRSRREVNMAPYELHVATRNRLGQYNL